MTTPSIIGFYGESNTGKTTLIVKIINRLSKDGFNVASVKISNKKISIDSEGKDTWKHAEAGSKLVVFSTENETDFLLKRKISNNEIVDNIKRLGNYDIILVEGANDENIPKIRLGEIKERKNTIFTYDDDFEELINFIKDGI
ncbi:MAG: molybdopterin-guanine dinucleotide biosynthesis protein B [Thermoplasmatales archaeon]|nr:molybdopterin-guanine dinucleotide biosynthesis protein B [Thermoplasmatales archaeon]